MSDNNDAGVLSLLQNGVQRAQVNGNNADSVDTLKRLVYACVDSLLILGVVDIVERNCTEWGIEILK